MRLGLRRNLQNGIPLNVCMYCGYRGEDLTDEHVIPYSLTPIAEPDLILEKSSCTSCRIITSRFERKAVEHIDDVREYLELKSRKGKRGGKNTNKVKRTGFVDALSHDRKSEIKISVKQSFPFLMIPYFPFHPRIITGDEKQDFHEKCSLWGLPLGVKNVPEGSVSFNRKKTYRHSSAYFRMCAKIAHSFCVMTEGLNGFKPLLLQFILSGKGDASLYIGGVDDGFLQEKSIIETGKEFLHAIDMFEVSCPAGEFLGARIKLFANHGAPSVFVIVGKICKTGKEDE